MATTDRRPTLTVREIRPHEAGTLARITLAAYEQLGFDLGTYRSSLADVAGRARAAAVLVAVSGRRLVGGVTYVGDRANPYAEFEDDDAAGIRMLAVDPGATRAGVGAALVQACLARAEAAGCRRVVLHTTVEMAAARRLYVRLGFQRTPDRDWRPQPHVALLGYERVLGPGASRRTVVR